MKNFLKINLYFIFCVYLLMGFFSDTFAAPTCSEKYLDSLGQCHFDCSSLGSDYNADNAIGLCDIGQVCCHKTASSSGLAQSIELQVPLFNYALAANLPEYILSVYKYTMIVVVPLAIIMIIIGGIFWISAAGNPEKIKKAKGYIFNAFIGLGLALFSYIFLSLVGITTLQLPGLENIDRIEGTELILYEQTLATYTPSPGGGEQGKLFDSAPTNIVTVDCDTIGGIKQLQVDQSVAEKVKKTCTDLKGAGFNVVKISGYRPKKNASDTGCHPRGLAIDVNENNNGCFNCYAVKGSTIPSGATFKTGSDPLAFTEKIVNIIKANGWCWGGDWNSIKDMHHFSSKNPLCKSVECGASRPYNWTRPFEQNLNP